MSGIKPVKDLQELAQSLASVAGISKHLNVLIFGAGLGGLAMLEALRNLKDVSVHAIVDIEKEPPAFQLARELNIPTSNDRDSVLSTFNGSIIIDVSGDRDLHLKLTEHTISHELELISAKSAKLLFDMANQEVINERTIQDQNTRLSLLDSLLEITLLLEHRPPIQDITSRSFADIHSHVDATRGMALMFDKESDKPLFIGTIGDKEPKCSGNQCDFVACQAINDACHTLTVKDRYKVFETAIKPGCSELSNSYNVVIPLWQGPRMSGALLFNIPTPLSKAQISSLEMASAHLNIAFKTLDHFQQLEEMAIFDALTGVFNRRKFDMQLHQEVSRANRMTTGTLACGFIDLDNFKQINDTYGHPVGDLVLKHIGRSIESCLRDYDLCARYGGDEFVILVPDHEPIDKEELEAIGKRILESVSEFSMPEKEELKVTVSIGIAIQPNNSVRAESLLKQADEALYKAKHAGKACLRIVSD